MNVRNDFAHAGVQKMVLAEHQPQYEPLPGLFYSREGYVLTEWVLEAEELAKLQAGGRVRLFTYTFGTRSSPCSCRRSGRTRCSHWRRSVERRKDLVAPGWR